MIMIKESNYERCLKEIEFVLPSVEIIRYAKPVTVAQQLI
jgi:hypothetical protein